MAELAESVDEVAGSITRLEQSFKVTYTGFESRIKHLFIRLFLKVSMLNRMQFKLICINYSCENDKFPLPRLSWRRPRVGSASSRLSTGSYPRPWSRTWAGSRSSTPSSTLRSSSSGQRLVLQPTSLARFVISELKTEEGYRTDIVRTMSAQCPHYVRTTSHEGYMSAQCPHNLGTMSAQYPS